MNVLQVNISSQVWFPLCLKLLPGDVQSGQEWWGSGVIWGEVGAVEMGSSRARGQRVWDLEGGCWCVHVRQQG